MTGVLVGVVWGYLVSAFAMMAALLMASPLTLLLLRVMDPVATIMTISGPIALLVAVAAGYEAARVGTGAALWSATLLGGLLIIMSFVPRPPRCCHHPFRRCRFWFSPVIAVLCVPFLIGGAILQQAQLHRLREVPALLTQL